MENKMKPRLTSRMSSIRLPARPHCMSALLRLDETLIGTPDYMGLAYFWHYCYRFCLRDATPARRCKVHDRLLKAGLDLDGESPAHDDIMFSKNK